MADDVFKQTDVTSPGPDEVSCGEHAEPTPGCSRCAEAFILSPAQWPLEMLLPLVRIRHEGDPAFGVGVLLLVEHPGTGRRGPYRVHVGRSTFGRLANARPVTYEDVGDLVAQWWVD